ncbi:MAG: ZIP family metal transporter [Haloarculaceae archaeon]
MDNNVQSGVINLGSRPSLAGLGGVALLLVLSVAGAMAGRWTVLIVGWGAFGALAAAIPLGVRAVRSANAAGLVWGYGLASGAMITSAAVFLVPQAIGLEPRIGGFGIAAGILGGFSAHILGHRVAHVRSGFDDTGVQLTAHALSAGAIIGLIYGSMTKPGLLLGLAIVSHKGPAGYAAARRLAAAGRSVTVLLLPAAGVGIAAIAVSLLPLPSVPAVNAGVFGFAAGVFLHLAMDFLPRCEVGSEVGEVARESADQHALLDRLRVHAVVSTVLGGLAVLGAWLAVGP